MCGGGGGSGGTITAPDTRAYDRMADMQMQAMREQSQGQLGLQQNTLSQALAEQQGILAELQSEKVRAANETTANSQRLSMLMGAPPPEKVAKSVVMGENREGKVRARGKKALKIDQASPGTGLNIT